MLKPILPNFLRKMFLLFCHFKIALLQFLKARPYDFLLVLAVLTYGIVFSYFTILKHNVFESYAWDLGIFNQALYTTVFNGKFLYYTAELFLNPTGCYFAVHVSPILFLLLPFYAINPSPLTLLVIKSFILALGAVPLYLLAKELLKSSKAGFMLAIAYLLYPALQGANWFDFQPQVFLPLLFFSSCYFMIKCQWKLYFVAMMFTLMVEEHAVFAVFILAAFFLFTDNVRSLFKSIRPLKMNKNLASIITMIICIIYFFITIYVKNFFPINQEFMQQYKAVSAFSILGVKEDPLLFPIYTLSNLHRAFEALMYDYPLKFLYIILLFGPLIFKPFRSKLILGILVLLMPAFLSNYVAYYTIGAHYPLYIIPFIFIAAIDSLRHLRLHAKIFTLKTMLIVTSLFIISTSPLSPLSNTFVNRGNLWYPIVNFSIGENVRSLNELIGVIPYDASVLTQNHIFPHVSSRKNAYVIPFYYVGSEEYVRFLLNSSEYVLLDLSSLDTMATLVLNEVTYNNSYGVYALGSQAILFKRGYQGEPIFSHYIGPRNFSAYKDLFVAPNSQIVSDLSTKSENVVLCPNGSIGTFVYGPYIYLLQGSYEVTFTIKVGEHDKGYIGTLDVSDNCGKLILSKRDVFGFELQPNEWTNYTLPFTSTKLRTSIEFRAFSRGTTDVYVDKIFLKRISPNATADFGLKTLSFNDLTLVNGYLSEEGFFVHPRNMTGGFFWYGPYMSIPLGSYRATFLLKISPSPQEPDERILTLSISADAGGKVLAEHKVNASDFLDHNKTWDWYNFPVAFIAEDSLKDVEFRGLFPSPKFDIYLAFILVERPD